MEIDDILPFEEIQKRFGGEVTRRTGSLQDLDLGMTYEPFEIGSAIGNAWWRICHEKGFKTDAINDYPTFVFDEGERRPTFGRPALTAIEDLIGEPLFKAMSYSKCFVGDKKCAELFVAETFPDVLHLGHVEFLNFHHPIPPDLRICPTRTHYGLGLLGTLVERMKRYAKEKSRDSITLTAAHPTLLPLFETHGFRLSAYGDADRRLMELKV